MDSSGHWHDAAELKQAHRRLIDAIEGAKSAAESAPRFVIELQVGSMVSVTRGEDKVRAVFLGAEKNKVSLRRIDIAGVVPPYLEFGETVTLSDGTTDVRAQVWDNRDGKIILRTLPIY